MQVELSASAEGSLGKRTDCINFPSRKIRNNHNDPFSPGSLHVSRLSIVIPVVGDSQGLDDTLVSVLENRPANCEVLVVHNQPYHDPYNLSDEVRFVEAERGASLVECWRHGIANSRSPVVHLLACGVEVCPGWADAAMRHFCDPAIAGVAAVMVDRDDRQKIISAGQGYRTEGTVWNLGQGRRLNDFVAHPQNLYGPDALAAFYRVSAVQSVGGFSSSIGNAMAGIDLALALHQAGFRCVVEAECLAHVAPATMYRESAFQRGRNAERLFWQWASSQGRLSSFIGHGALLAGQSVISLWRPSMIAQLVGRACGFLGAMFAERRPQPKKAASAEGPSIVPAPHFSVAPVHQRQQTSRVA
jgi:hypothetical protein